mgnify:CR=1 FL=1
MEEQTEKLQSITERCKNILDRKAKSFEQDLAIQFIKANVKFEEKEMDDENKSIAAYYDKETRTIVFNKLVVTEMRSKAFKQLVLHQLAHAYCHWLYTPRSGDSDVKYVIGVDAKVHDLEWKHIASKLGVRCTSDTLKAWKKKGK